MISDVVFFDQAFDAAVRLAKDFAAKTQTDVILVRDLKGRIRVVLPSGRGAPERIAFAKQLVATLGAYGHSEAESLLFRDEMGPLESLLAHTQSLGDGVSVLDRQIIGHDWTRGRLKRLSTNRRFTFHGLKGGVGRSTAMIAWSWHLAEQGRKVLVCDLDLESPGLSSTLLPLDQRPDFGLVDWFVEDGVSQGEKVLSDLVARSPLAGRSDGQILVAPALGSRTGLYMPKLSRCYSDFSAEGASSWAERLNRLIESLEAEYRPDVVLFDSRAGLHDIASVLITRMDADCFLFAVDSRQTWDGYGSLFRQWKDMPDLSKEIRQRLQMVAGLVPDTGIEAYLESFQIHSWDLFRENLYDEVAAEDLDAFSFDLDDHDAPHSPGTILWHRALMEFDPLTKESNIRSAVDVAYAAFFNKADRLADVQEGDFRG